MKSLLSILVLAIAANATVIRVAKDGLAPYNEVQPAINAAVSGDTIFVFPGTYVGFTVDRTLMVIGSGTDTTVNGHTKITGPVTVLDAADNSSIQSVWMSTAAGSNVVGENACVLRIRLSAENIHLNSNYIVNTNGGSDEYQGSVYLGDQTSCIIERCVLDCRPEAQPGNTDAGIIVLGASSATVSNSTFVVNDYGIYGGGSIATLYVNQCIFTSGIAIGSLAGGGTLENCFIRIGASNNPNIIARYCAFVSGGSGEGNVVVPLSSFVNYVENDARQSDYHLTTGSIMIDAGKPTAPPDQDGSRADIGIYGGQTPFLDNGYPPFPIVTDLDVPSSVPVNGVLRFGASGRIGTGN